ncbi:MAG: hypothetical protein O7C98_01910, partial [Planctomycetota bacterium]|nr:hypothetical protein [Planctomycetota bacterium]
MARVGMRDVLGRHFQEATRCLPGPLGDDAVEWDYSRVSRALGLAGTPTLDELPHSGAAVLGLPVGEWAATAEMYREWAQEAGWSFVHTSATPTVAVPDPVIYALGLGVAGPDSLIFGRALNRRCAFLGPRPRSEGMSIALTPGERWLIGADRVRRRCGQEAAGNGLLVVVEDAEHITPSAAAVLGYSIEAHRAWKGRMLSRDAKVYVVFVSTPEHEQRLLDLLEENDLRGDIRTVNGSAPSPPFATYGTDFVGVEEEHILGALRDAPFALSSMDVQAIFGRAGLETCRGLAERGYLAARVQNGLEYWVEAPRGRQIGRFDAPAARVRRAVLDRYALLARQGREWLRPGAALLAFRLGRRSLALGFVGRTGHAECALVPAALFGELDGHLEASREELRCYHFAAWFGMAAHRRRYAHAGALARDLTRIPLRTELDLTRTVIHILCAGRTHLDHALPSNFWTSLHSDTLDPSLLDATAILSDVFVRLR